MENTKPKHVLYDRPYLGALVAFIITFLVAYFGGIILGSVLSKLGFLNGDSATYLFIGIITLVCLLVHRLWFRKDGYKGSMTYTKAPTKDVWVVICIVAVADIVSSILGVVTQATEGPLMVMPTLDSLIMAFFAGTFEEPLTRGIPVSIMMKNQPDRKRMIVATVASAVAFGAYHIMNTGAGAKLDVTLMQCFSAVCIGTFFAAVYIRTGNILITMVFHMIHDVIAFMNPLQATGVLMQDSVTASLLLNELALDVVMAAAAIYLLRKSKWEEIKDTWANIWAE